MEQILETIAGQDLDQWLRALVPRLVTAGLVFFAFWILYRLTRPPLRAMLRRGRVAEPLIVLMVDNTYKAAVLIFGAVMAVSQLGIDVGAALAGIGVVGIAVGFAAQETIANMIAGFLIFWDRPFEVGHYITAQGNYGIVRDITMRSTRIQTQENTWVVIPNKQVIGDLLVNHSMYGKTRINVPLGIAYKEAVAKARPVLLAAAAGTEGVLADPPPLVVVTSLGDSGVNLEIRVWVGDAADERPVLHRTLEACKTALDQAGIEIPFPHLQLFVEDVRSRVWEGLGAARRG